MSVHLLLAAPVSVAAGGYDLGSGRTVPTVAAVVGLISVITGGLSRARFAGRLRVGTKRPVAIAALVLGLISMIVGGLHAVSSTGGFGTGNGLAGAIVALVLGLAGMILGGLSLTHPAAPAASADPALKLGRQVGIPSNRRGPG